MTFRLLSRPALGLVLAGLLVAMIAGISWSDDGEEESAAEPTYMDQYIGADAGNIGVDQCLMCHDTMIPETLFSHVSLIDRDEDNPNYGFSCEGCHGPGEAHWGDPAGILHPGKMEPDDVAELCSQCHPDHRSFNVQNWYQSEHYYSKMDCLDCHSGHSENDFFLVKDDQLDLCFTCHMDKRSEFNMRSHHPVSEGQLECTSCHYMHSGEFDYQLKADGDELCFECHGDKEGPFAYDHDVNQDAGGDGCLTCHFVHGGNTDNLLRYPQRVCLQCHSEMDRNMHFPGTCWTSGCHSEIHGSYTHPLFFN